MHNKGNIKYQISASTPFAAKPRTFNVAAVASLLARVSIPSLMLFLGLAKIYGRCFWEWIDMDCLFDLVCMDLYGSVWCLTRTLWTNSETPVPGQPIQRSAENCPNMSLLPKLWRLRLSMLLILASPLLLIQVQSRPGMRHTLGIFGYSQCQCWRVMKGYEGLKRRLSHIEHFMLLCAILLRQYSTHLESFTQFTLQNVPWKQAKILPFLMTMCFLTSLQCIVGCVLKSTEVQHTFAVFPDLQRNASQPERKHGKLGKSVQPNLDSTCFKHRGNFHAWPGSLKHVETDNLTLNLKSTPSVMVSVVKVQKTCVACGGGEYGLIVFVEDDAAPVV